MAGFEFFSEETQSLERQIEHLGMALGIDWSDQAQVRELAREALAHGSEDLAKSSRHGTDYALKAKVELFGIAALMLKVMEKSAENGAISHGGKAWKAFAGALWDERGGSAKP